MTYLGNHTKDIKSKLYLTNIKVKTPLNGARFYLPMANNNGFKIRRLYTGGINQLGYYLAGLIEGDGSIILRKGEREKISPKIVFTFGKKETPLYERLRKILNTGVIYEEKTGVSRYSITNADAVINIINLVNGKFRTPKIQALHKAIDNLNLWRNANLLKLPLDKSGLDTNA